MRNSGARFRDFVSCNQTVYCEVQYRHKIEQRGNQNKVNNCGLKLKSNRINLYYSLNPV